LPAQFAFGTPHSYAGSRDGIAIPVSLRIGTAEVEFTAMLDTGATFCLFQRSYGEALGLDIETGVRQEFRTATGNFVAYGHDLTLTTLGVEMDSNVYFFADAAIRRNVLGRRGWLDRVRLAVVDYEEVLSLAPYDSPVQ
jgi:hypothetical protein